ncbi:MULTISPECIES: recombinase family protein [Streptomyces]|uniref:Recombinase family protein n=1 Tax=Streptomyces lonegramiae TaxID=3075524 RepID=A0ABU2XJE5_9ACTN|nr:recombinase family protein [Streptomyces sp. DSM 41529]MDT0546048.1 recombinase family protein [Streptomyces sp. DSM 41529]
MHPTTRAGDPEHVVTVLRVAAGYTRQSKAKADKSEASPQTQDEATEKKARERGCSFKGHYRDIGVSGYDPNAKRKAFEQLLNDCRAGLVHEIIVFNVTRFSRREPRDTIPVVLELFSLGVTITSVSEGSFSPDDTMELIMLVLRLDLAHQDSKNRSQVITGAKQLAKEFGSWTGGALPYGLESYAESVAREMDGKPVTVTVRRLRPASVREDGTDQAGEVLKMVDRIFEYKDKPWEGKKNAHPASVGAIVTWLNSRNVRTQKGGLWRERAVKRLLTDPRLAGMAAEPVYALDKDGNKTRNVSGYRILRDEAGEPVTIGQALIPSTRFFELQEWLTGRGRGSGASPGKYVLTALGKLYCECGRPMTGSRDVYKCSRPSGVVEEGKHEGGSTIQQVGVDTYVASKIMAVITNADEEDPETLDILGEAASRLAQRQERPEVRSERATLLGERAETVRSIERLYADLRIGIYDGEIGRRQFLADKKSLEARLQGIDVRIAEVGSPGLPPLPVEEWADSEDGDPLGPHSWWARADVDDRRMLVELFVNRVTVAKAETRGGTERACRVEDRVTVLMSSSQANAEERTA